MAGKKTENRPYKLQGKNILQKVEETQETPVEHKLKTACAVLNSYNNFLFRKKRALLKVELSFSRLQQTNKYF